MAGLYQQIVLQHFRSPQNHRELSEATHSGDGINPICGDQVHLQLAIEGDLIAAVGFTGDSCAICKATASLMTDAIEGQLVSTAQTLRQAFEDLLKPGEETPSGRQEEGSDGVPAELSEGLLALADVRHYPTRIKCALLPWRALDAALKSSHGTVSTE